MSAVGSTLSTSKREALVRYSIDSTYAYPLVLADPLDVFYLDVACYCTSQSPRICWIDHTLTMLNLTYSYCTQLNSTLHCSALPYTTLTSPYFTNVQLYLCHAHSGLKRLQAIILGLGVPDIIIEKAKLNKISLILSPTVALKGDELDDSCGGEEGFYF